MHMHQQQDLTWQRLSRGCGAAQVKGEHHNWDQEEIPVARSRNYTARGIAGDFVIPRQYIGGFDLESGTKVYLR